MSYDGGLAEQRPPAIFGDEMRTSGVRSYYLLFQPGGKWEHMDLQSR